MALKKEFQFYLNNQDKLVEKYDGKFLAIVGEEVVGAYNSEAEAFLETQKDYKVGTFLVQRCSPGDSDYTQTFHSRVAFC